MTKLKINGKSFSFDGDETMPLLWYLRDFAGYKGAKFGCGAALCGACTVHVDGAAVRSCVRPVGSVDGAEITTIEGLSDGDKLHPVQQAWIDEDVAQCGYCQAGQIMAVVELLSRMPNPSDADIDANLTNICRCGTFVRVREGIHLSKTKKA